MVPPACHGVSRVPRYSGFCSLTCLFTYTALTFSGLTSHSILLRLVNAKCSPQPHKDCSLWFGLFPFRSPLLRKSRLISLPRPTWMFQFRRFPPHTYGFSVRYASFACVDCSIRTSPAQCVLTAPRSFSQLITSFIGSQCQGIRPALFIALPFASCF